MKIEEINTNTQPIQMYDAVIREYSNKLLINPNQFDKEAIKFLGSEIVYQRILSTFAAVDGKLTGRELVQHTAINALRSIEHSAMATTSAEIGYFTGMTSSQIHFVESLARQLKVFFGSEPESAMNIPIGAANTASVQ